MPAVTPLNSTHTVSTFGPRKENVTIVKPIVIGSYAFMFPQHEISRRRNRSDSATHRWYCVIRSPTGEDTSYFIRKVVINLHSSFINPQRTLEKPPYQVSEVGWGEFEIVAKVYFVDPNERPVELRHWLRLYPPGVEDFERYRPPEGSQQCVATETYDEIFFHDPSHRFHEILMNGPFYPTVQYEMAPYFLKHRRKEEYLAALATSTATVNRNIEAATAKAASLTLEVEKLKELYYATHDDKAVAVLNKEKALVQASQALPLSAAQAGAQPLSPPTTGQNSANGQPVKREAETVRG